MTRIPAPLCATCSTAWSLANDGPTSTPTWRTPPSPGGPRRSSGATPVPPASLAAAWRALYCQYWLALADVLVAQPEAIRLSDPRLRRAAAALAAGRLVADYTFEPTSPTDGQSIAAGAMAHHDYFPLSPVVYWWR